MENNEINKITVGKSLYTILYGFIVNCLIAIAITSALSLKYQISLYNKSGEINTNLAILIMTSLSAFLGGLFTGGVIRKRGWLFGTLTVFIPFCISLLIIWLYSIGKTLTETGQIWFIRAMKNMLIFTLIQLPFSSIGGFLGEKIYRFDLTEEGKEYADIYFKPHFRILIILPIITVSIFLLTYYLDRAFLYIKWMIIGDWYILTHPILLPELWIFFYIFLGLFSFLTSVFISPLFTISSLPLIWIKHRNPIVNIFFSLLLLFGTAVGTNLADNKIGYAPIKWIVTKVLDRKGKVWPILLDKELAKLQKSTEELTRQKPIKEPAKSQNKPIIVIPAEGAMGIKLGMNKEEVISILGHPKRIDYTTDPKDGEVLEILSYTDPPVGVLLDKNNNVFLLELMTLGYIKDIEVIGYNFLEFDKYLTEQELNIFGKPDVVIRDLTYEKIFNSKLPEGTIVESYMYIYENLGLTVGFAFDRTRQKEGKKDYIIGPYRIFIGKELSKVFK